MKKILIALSLLSAAAPLAAMDPSSLSAISDTSSSATSASSGRPANSPTFGRLINRKVWAAIIALKKGCQSLPKLVTITILEHYLATGPLVEECIEAVLPRPQPQVEDIPDGALDPRVLPDFNNMDHYMEQDRVKRLNVALEFIADPAYTTFQRSLIEFVYARRDLAFPTVAMPAGTRPITPGILAQQQRYSDETISAMMMDDFRLARVIMNQLMGRPLV